MPKNNKIMKSPATSLGKVTVLALSLPTTTGLLPLPRPLQPLSFQSQPSSSSPSQRSSSSGGGDEGTFSSVEGGVGGAAPVGLLSVRRRRRRPASLGMLGAEGEPTTLSGTRESDSLLRHTIHVDGMLKRRPALEHSQEVSLDGDVAGMWGGSLHAPENDDLLGISSLGKARFDVGAEITVDEKEARGQEKRRGGRGLSRAPSSRNIWNVGTRGNVKLGTGS